MKIFVDANVLVAVLNKEYPLFSDAARVLSLPEKASIQIYTSPVCLAIAFYFAEKKSGRTMAKKKMTVLCSHLSITLIDSDVVFSAINDSRVLDFEDGLEYYSASAAGCKVIVTENTEDFYFSEMVVMKCRELLDSELIKA
jgi:predicted nucleic acid-binding protein